MSIDFKKEFEEHIKHLVSSDITQEQVYIFTLKMCNNEIDSDFDKLTPEFLRQFAEQVNNNPIPLIKDHRWSADGQIGRVYRAEVLSDGKNSLGETYEYVLGYAYVAAESEVVPRIKLGLLSEVSVGFDGSDYICSVCGAQVESYDHKCPNDHVFGSLYDDKTAYRIVGRCDGALECSFTPVPAQEGAEIQSKSQKEGFKLKRSEFLRILGIKAKKADEETREVIEEEVSVTEEESKAEVTEEDKVDEETPAEEETKVEETPTDEEDPEVTIADLAAAIAELKACVDDLKAAKNVYAEEVVDTKTKARTQYAQERPVSTGIKTRVNLTGSNSVKSKTRMPYVVDER